MSDFLRLLMKKSKREQMALDFFEKRAISVINSWFEQMVLKNKQFA